MGVSPAASIVGGGSARGRGAAAALLAAAAAPPRSHARRKPQTLSRHGHFNKRKRAQASFENSTGTQAPRPRFPPPRPAQTAPQ